MIYFTSDHHFGHKNILKYTDRDFSNVEEMDEFLIESWNSQVKMNDTVYYLGDMILGFPQYAEQVLKQLNGKIHLIKGNHDKFLNDKTKNRFESIKDYYKLRVNDTRIILMHFPLAEWDMKYHGSIHLHGHSHGNYKGNGRILDVGIDNHIEGREKYKFWSIDEVTSYMEKIEN